MSTKFSWKVARIYAKTVHSDEKWRETKLKVIKNLKAWKYQSGYGYNRYGAA